MTWLAALLSTLHVAGIVATMGSMYLRSWFLRAPLDAAGLRRVFVSDNVSGISAMVLLGTGLLRAFAGLEKAADFYLFNGMFWIKMALVVVVLGLESIPMATLIRWRIAQKKGQTIDTSRAKVLARISHAELGLMLLILFAAPLMARAVWLFG